MRRADQVAGVVLFACAVAFSGVALQLEYWSLNGPGPGFMPFWLGLAMAVLAVLLVVGATRSREPGERWLPTRPRGGRLVAVLLTTVVFVALLNVVGMILGCALFLITLLRLVDRYPWPRTLAIAVGTAAVNYLVFTYWLRVPFPVSLLGF